MPGIYPPVLLTILTACSVALLAVEPVAADPPENIAKHRPYRLWPPPNYPHCTDPDDTVQLTDGRYVEGYFWVQRGTVGWVRVQYATITVDLGRVEPIQGAALRTAAGTAGVVWPAAVYVLVSDDGRSWYKAGELVALDQQKHGPWPRGYAVRRLATMSLRALGRYVQFVLVPAAGGIYLFTDEVEVFRGPARWLETPPERGEAVTAAELVRRARSGIALSRRWRADRAALRTVIEQTPLDAPVRAALLRRWRQLPEDGLAALAADPRLRTTFPIGPAHAELFRIQAALWQAAGRPALSATVPASVWDPLPLFGVPREQAADQGLSVELMRGEYRAAAVNLYNATQQGVTVRVSFSGLPGSPCPPYVQVHYAEWTDTSVGQPVAAALPEATRGPDGWAVPLVPGLPGQLWLTFQVRSLPPGEYTGQLLLRGAGSSIRVPVRLHVWPVDFPPRTTLLLGGWSYTDGPGAYGITPQNRSAFVRMLREHFVNAPWATGATMKAFRIDPEQPDRVQLDTARMDRWLDEWPDASMYFVFLSVARYGPGLQRQLGGAALGSDEFRRRVAAWIRAWVTHLRKRGVTPNRLGLLLHDEPHEGSDVRSLIAWAEAIQAAEPEVVIWEDPTYREPWRAPQQVFALSDVLCPNRIMWLSRGKRFAEFYRGWQQQRGKVLHFYACSGPAKVLDPYSYYRLQAWHCWQVGARGSFFWAFGDNGGCSSWHEYLARHGPYTPLFLDETTVVTGKHLEAIREGVQDYEYLVLLRAAVQKARGRGVSGPALAAAERLLRQAADEVLRGQTAAAIRWAVPKDRTGADRLRRRVLEALVRLTAGDRSR